MQNFAFCNHLKRKKFNRGAHFCEYQLNRVRGKRNSLLSTFVFRPLTHRTHSSAFAIVFRYKLTFGRFLSPFSKSESIYRYVVCQVVRYGGRGQPTASESGRCLPETSSRGSEDAGNGRRAERSAAE